MPPQILPKPRFTDFVRFLLSRYRLVGPVASPQKTIPGGGHAFQVITDPSQLDMNYPITMLPPKKYFLPQEERLLQFDRAGSAQPPHAAVDAQPTAVLGAHPCDVCATWLLDDVFHRDPADPYYLTRRDRAVIIGLDCLQPCDQYQFCKDMGSLYVNTGYDLMLADLGDRYYVHVGTDLGRQLVHDSGCCSPAGPADQEAYAAFERHKQDNFINKIPYSVHHLPQILGDSYDSLIWDAAARRCFSCGTCNLVCPTCYCFDVFDRVDMNLASGQRRRNWDACMLQNFAEVAGGENFRDHRSARLRHRAFRKGKYILEQFGKSGCVGCGRCDRHCTADISILRIYQQLAAEVHAPTPT